MNTFRLLVIASACAPGLAHAQDMSIQQFNRVNIYGLVQASPNPSSVVVNQSGFANMAGVVQAGPSTSATIRQNGTYNAAIIGQFGTVYRGFMP